jgi:hypothetical protein
LQGFDLSCILCFHVLWDSWVLCAWIAINLLLIFLIHIAEA